MDGFTAAARLLPGDVRRGAESLSQAEKLRCEEFRLRRGRPPTARLDGREEAISDTALTERDLCLVLEAATRSSFHAAAAELRRGYVTARGGVRVGVCGTAVDSDTGLEGLRDISSLSLRLPRQVPGCADAVWPAVTEGGLSSLLIVSPPGAGKTTLLREIVRRSSETGVCVCVADERAEIGGEGSFDLGPHTDVMTGVPKAAAAGMLLRAMNPAVLAMDEITDPADAQALLHAVGCGVLLLATVHGGSLAEIRERPALRPLLEAGAFRRYVVIENRDGRRRYRAGEIP